MFCTWVEAIFGYQSLGNPMDWVTSQVSQNTPFSLTITLPILSEQWYNLAYILFLYTVKLTNMDYSSCSVWLDMCCFTCWSALLARNLFGLILKPFFRPVKIGLRRTSPPSPPLCAAMSMPKPQWSNFIPYFIAIGLWASVGIPMLGLKSIHVRKRSLRNSYAWIRAPSLTILVLKPECSRMTRSIQSQLMDCFLVSPGHQAQHESHWCVLLYSP